MTGASDRRGQRKRRRGLDERRPRSLSRPLAVPERRSGQRERQRGYMDNNSPRSLSRTPAVPERESARGRGPVLGGEKNPVQPPGRGARTSIARFAHDANALHRWVGMLTCCCCCSCLLERPDGSLAAGLLDHSFQTGRFTLEMLCTPCGQIRNASRWLKGFIIQSF